MAPLVAGTSSITDAFVAINSKLWSIYDVVFKSDSTPYVMSPFETVTYHYASCTGTSILLVDALRSVGIPCRLVGTPCWNTPTGGNHCWVEVLVDGYWSFTEPWNLGFNSTWFWPDPAKLSVPGEEHGIWAVSYTYKSGDAYFPMSWAPSDKSFYGIDITTFYTQFVPYKK